MKLWLLRPVKDSPRWEPWYDKAFGFVVRAETELAARHIADTHAGDEEHPRVLETLEMSLDWNTRLHTWEDSAHASCVELAAEGAEGLILRDFASA